MHLSKPSPALVIACVALLLAAGGSAVAATTLTGTAVNLVDATDASRIAHVDSTGKLLVGDGSSFLTVNGTVLTQPADPGTPWRASLTALAAGPVKPVAGPTTLPISVTSVSFSLPAGVAANAIGGVKLQAAHVSISATSCVGASSILDSIIWNIPRVTASAPGAVTFPTPLRYTAPSGKACLFVASTGNDVAFNASGFYGG
jgi:hypothetical protein